MPSLPTILHDLRTRLFREPFRIVSPGYVEAIEVATRAGDAVVLCRAMCDYAFAIIHMSDARRAIDLLRDAHALAVRLHDEALMAECELWQAAVAHWTNDAGDVVARIDVVVERCALAGRRDLLSVAACLKALQIERRTSSLDSIRAFDHALQLLSSTDDPWTISFVHRYAGLAWKNAGNNTHALEHLEFARDVAERHGLLAILARTLGSLGTIHLSTRHTKLALDELLPAIKLYEDLEISDWYVAECLLGMGTVLTHAADYVPALSYLQRAFDVWQLTGDHAGQGRAMNVMGAVHDYLHEDDAALSCYERSYELFRSSPWRDPNETFPLSNRAQIHIRRGEYPQARTLLETALDHATTTKSPRGTSLALTALGGLFANPNTPFFDDKHAEELLLQTLDVDKAGGFENEEALKHLSELYEARGDATKALEYHKRYTELVLRMKDDSAQRRVSEIETQRAIEAAKRQTEIEHLRNVELKNALDELRSAQTQLIHAEKMASLGQLTAGIAHEINNPINFIASSIGPLRRDLRDYDGMKGQGSEASELRDEIITLLNGIETGAHRTAEIVKSLRSFTRLDEGDVKKVDLHEGLESTLTLLGTRLRDGVAVVRHYASLPPVECNAGQVNQVFMNVIANALDALEGRADKRIEITTSLPDPNHVAIRIADNGPGVPDDVLDHLFEPFFTTKDVGKGTGLGLSISYGIIDQHQGSISVEVDHGTAFIITLPLVHSQRGSSQTETA